MFNSYESIINWANSLEPTDETETDLYNGLVNAIDDNMKDSWDGSMCTYTEDSEFTRVLDSLNSFRKDNLILGITNQYLAVGWDVARVATSPGYEWQLTQHV